MGGRRNPSAETGDENMNLMIATVAVLALVGLAKNKKPVFGQLTLTGEKALDWLKTADAEKEGGISFAFQRIRMVLTETLASEGWNVPDWKEGRTWTALGFLAEPEYANPIWIHQRSAVQELERRLADWEAQGATVNDKERSIDFGDGIKTLNFQRGEGKFARYTVTEED